MVGIKSDKGIVRKLNEDYADFIEGDKYKLYIVADGMGGHNAGEVASKLAVESVIKNFQLDKNLEKAIKEANNQVFRHSISEESLGGMGTTITACLLSDDIIEVANVGDSCCFGINENEITKITKDHSLVQELIDSGSITEEEGIRHPKRNIITRALGTDLKVKVDIFAVKRGQYKMFLLCTDGLINEVSKEDALNIITSYNDLQLCCEKLVDLAKERGGRDNITVLLFGGEV